MLSASWRISIYFLHFRKLEVIEIPELNSGQALKQVQDDTSVSFFVGEESSLSIILRLM